MNQAQCMLINGLTRTNHVANAALIKISDGKVLASTPSFKIHSQTKFLIDAFYKNLHQVRKNGLYFKAQHYTCVRADDIAIYGKGKDNGLVAVKTKSFILVATYTQGMYPSVCVEAVEKLADYFRAKGN
uniref:profilin-4 n=1 Tax=Euleptes europaea TaxID=460621 RepID=UPI002540BC9C|nr:profilin-4 [Euleptes europaea]